MARAMALFRDSRVLVYLAAAFIVLFGLLGLQLDNARSLVDRINPPRPHLSPVHVLDDQRLHAPAKERLAYVTWLSSTVAGADSEKLDEDVYFIATRILVWQLLHNPKTRTNGIDVVVVVTPDVSASRISRLRKDGAIVRHIDFVHGNDDSWLHPDDARWSDIMSKLRVWQLTEYSRILMLDGDMVLQRPLDAIFDEPGAQIVPTLANVSRLDDEPALPETYMLASFGETPGAEHGYPPTWTDLKKYGRVCAGFFLLKPSEEIFKYYTALLDLKDRFDSKYMEQNLLNYAHRWEGAMPWKEIPTTWNIRSVNDNDFDQGVASMHEKWWDEPFSHSEKIKNYFKAQRWAMEGYYMALDKVEAAQEHRGPVSRVLRRGWRP